MIDLMSVVTYLKADSMITGYTGDRIYDHDVRRRKHPEIMSTADFKILPTISVDDGPSAGRGFGGPGGSSQDILYVWVFTRNYPEDHDIGLPVNRAITERVMELLHDWQDPATRSMLIYRGRLGNQDGVLTDSGMDRVQFEVQSIFKVT
jgi:hypothetical protein